MKIFVAYDCDNRTFEDVIKRQVKFIQDGGELIYFVFNNLDVEFEYIDTEIGSKLEGAEALLQYIQMHIKQSQNE